MGLAGDESTICHPIDDLERAGERFHASRKGGRCICETIRLEDAKPELFAYIDVLEAGTEATRDLVSWYIKVVLNTSSVPIPTGACSLP